MKEKINKETGEIIEPKLNQVIIKRTIRPNGTLREQQDFSNCPTLAEQHTAHLTDINYLIEKYKPDELAAYIAARNQYRQEIIGHDFSEELSMQDAMNVVYRSKQEFEALPDEVKYSFKNHLEFLKFVDNPANAEKLVKLGLITPKQVEEITMEKPAAPPANTDDEVRGGHGEGRAKGSSKKADLE